MNDFECINALNEQKRFTNDFEYTNMLIDFMIIFYYLKRIKMLQLWF